VSAALNELRQRLAVIHDLRQASLVLEWDQLVKMPPLGGPVRAHQLETLELVAHERFTDPAVGRLLDELGPLEETLDYDSDDASLIRVTRRDWEKARRIPVELVAELRLVASEAETIWTDARARNDYESFRPWLDRNIDLRRRYLECFEPFDDPYDPLLDDYEPGMKTAEVRVVFDQLRPVLTSLVAELASEDEPPFIRGPFPTSEQEELGQRLLVRFGLDRLAHRLDPTVHPFCLGIATGDIRVTTRYAEDDLHSLFSTMHECGHGLYEHGVSKTLERTPLGSGVSSALHESQSRLWENVVGRSLPFWRGFYPELQVAFPRVLRDVGADEFYAAINRVHRSFIRVDADEVGYGLHVIMRFELEQELISGRLSTADLPEAWNARFAELMGVEVPENRLGVLQDIHWAFGGFGYFPTYQLGNVISIQIWEKAREALPDLDAQIEAGELGGLGAWLRENLYSLGRKFTPQETLRRVAGGPLDAGPYLAYLEAKYAAGIPA
jgi:carboxypeptidase Taq